MPHHLPHIRNSVARSPLLRKGGVHQRPRSGERQQHRQWLEDELDVWWETQTTDETGDETLGLSENKR